MGEQNNDISFVEEMLLVFIERDDSTNILKLIERIGPQVSLDVAAVVSNHLMRKGYVDVVATLISNLPVGETRDGLTHQLVIYCLTNDTNNIRITQAVRQLQFFQNQTLRLSLARRCFKTLVSRTWRNNNDRVYLERMPTDFPQLVETISQSIKAVDQQSERWFEQKLLAALEAGSTEMVWRIGQFLPEERRHDIAAIVQQ